MNHIEQLIVDHVRNLSDEELAELIRAHLDVVLGGKRKAKVRLPKPPKERPTPPLKAGPRRTLQTIMGYQRVTPHPGRLATKLGMSQSGIRAHLAQLEAEGYIVRQRKGRRVCYRVVNQQQ